MKAENSIARNVSHGVEVLFDDSLENAIRGNSIYENGDLGINLDGASSPTPNDPDDVDTGPNLRQNHPEID